MSNLNLVQQRRYGLYFPKEVNPIFIDLLCAKHWRDPEYRAGNLMAPGDHMLAAIKALFSPSEWTISPWTEEHCHGWCQETCLGILGSAASSKSFDIGGLAMLDFLTDPVDTVTIMASTSKMALADRTFASAIKLFQILKRHPKFEVPGHISKTTMAIVLGDGDGDIDATSKTALRGVALAQGTAEEARGSLQGRHAKYVRLIADELAAMKETIAEAVVDARTNLSIGAEKDFKFCYLANPESMLDVCGRLSEPKEGWASVDENTPRWRTRAGLVLRRNGFQSPAILDPDGVRKYPYLIRQAQIDKIVEEERGNLDARRVWTMIKGFPPPTGTDNSVLSQADLVTFHAREPVEWANADGQPCIWVAGLDPAFTSGGDNCVLQFARVGRSKEGVYTIAFEKPEVLPIAVSSKRPATYQVVDQLGQRLAARNVPVANLAVDDSGTQSVADVIEVELGARPIRCNFSSKATEPTDGTKSRFKNQVTEIWHQVAALVRENQIRQMPDDAASQFCNRRYRRDLTPLALESKQDYAKRNRGNHSPDEADALALCCLAANRVAGLGPGRQVPEVSRGRSFWFFGRRKNIDPDYTKPVDDRRFSVYSTDVTAHQGLSLYRRPYE